MALQRELLHLGAADVPLVGDHLGRAELADLLIAIAGPPAGRAAEGVGEAIGLAGQHGRRDRDGVHVLHAAGDDQILGSAHHALGREMHRLLGRAALAVDGHAGDVFGQARRQPAGTGDVAGLRTDGVAAAEDHVLDGAGIDPDARHQGRQDVGAQIGRMDVSQSALLAPDRGADGVDDIGLMRHGRRLPSGRPRRSCGRCRGRRGRAS